MVRVETVAEFSGFAGADRIEEVSVVEVGAFLIDSDTGYVSFLVTVEPDTHNSALVIDRHFGVHGVMTNCDFSQVVPTVIAPVVVDVVDVLRPASCHPHPDGTVNKHSSFVYAQQSVPIYSQVPSFFARVTCVPSFECFWSVLKDERSSMCVIIKEIFNICIGYFHGGSKSEKLLGGSVS